MPIKITAPKNAPKSDYRSWRFAILDSSLRSSTLEMINQAKPWFTSSDQAERIAQFNDLADEVIDGFENGESSKIGSAMNSANELLDEAGLVPPKLTEIINIARECGAEGAKITGAGGGGCILALLDAANADLSLEQLKNQLGKNRVNEVTLL